MRVASAEEDGDCWLWTGRTDSEGYGRFEYAGRKNVLSHHVAWFLTYGVWPTALQHSCDTPPCCNLDHLKESTQLENLKDRDNKLRFAHKLAIGQVEEIRVRATNGETQRQIAADYGVASSQVSRILHRKTWKVLA